VSNISSNRPALPMGWHYPTKEEAQGLEAELQREFPPGHFAFWAIGGRFCVSP
jgi:hypothetical protein